MGFLKKFFGSGKKDEEKVDEEVIEDSIETDNEDSIDVDDNNDDAEVVDKPLEITDEEPIENKEEINEEPAQPRNFKYLDDLIHSGVKEVILDSDIVLDDVEESNYKEGIKLDVDGLVIDGNGHTIDANGKTRIFHSSCKNITLKNTTLKHGYAQEGGAIANEGTMFIKNSEFVDNTAQDYGGAIVNEGDLTIIKNIFVKNESYEHGGAILNAGNLTVTDCKLNENTAQGYGGAIVNVRCETSIKESIITHNTAKINGGAIYNFDSKLIITESTLRVNTSNQNGGAICGFGEITLIESKLTENSADNGGAIYSKKSHLKLKNCIIKNNDVNNIAKIENFNYLDDLIHNGVKEIVLDSDIVLDDKEESDYESGIKLDVDDLVIDGNGHVINANGKTRIFEVSGKNIIIKNIKFKNGFTEENGGAIYIEKGTLTIIGSALEGNIAMDDGGAIYNYNGTLAIVDSTLLENSTDNMSGGAIYNNGGYLTIMESTLKENVVNREYGRGGAIYNNGGDLTIKESELGENTADWGGAIVNCGDLTVMESTLTGNTAKDAGGAIFNSGKVFVPESINMYEGKLTIIESTFIGNTVERSGGAINNEGELNINKSIFTENTANRWGGAVDNNGLLTILKSSFNDNLAKDAGVINNSWKAELTITESTLIRNKSNEGGLIINHGNINVISCNFSNNKSANCIIYNHDSIKVHGSDFMSNHAQGVIVNEGDFANFALFNGQIKDNNISDSLIFNDGKSFVIEKTIFENHIFNSIINKSKLTLKSPKIKDESKILNEKYILIRKSSDGLEDKIYGEGTVDNGSIFEFKEFDFGSLDKKIHESITKEIKLEEDISFEEYEIDYYEGGIELDIDNLIIDGNGHTIDACDKTRIFYCTGKNITLKNITFKNGYTHKDYNNPFNNNGGAIKINRNANLTMENCKFINNSSEDNGGAIGNRGKLIIIESIFNNNAAIGMHDSSGGAIENMGELIITESTLAGNTAKIGGAIFNVDNGELTIIESVLNENIAKYNWGGAICNRGKLNITKSILTKNTAEFLGGAILNWEGGTLTITESVLAENTADLGGAIVNREYSKLTITESTLSGNTAKDAGGAILLDKYSKKYESNNCTFKDNKPDDVRRTD